jgi:hypothetical protein
MKDEQVDFEVRSWFGEAGLADKGIFNIHRFRNFAAAVIAADRATAPVSVAEPVAAMDDMRMLIERLAHSLRKAAPGNDLSDQAMDYLKRMGLVGSPLRNGDQS